METVLVKLVVFKSSSEDLFFSYCPATHDFASKGKTVEETANSAKKWLLQLLENRIAYKNSRNYGWQISENSQRYILVKRILHLHGKIKYHKKAADTNHILTHLRPLLMQTD